MLSSYQIRDHGIITWKKFHKGSLSILVPGANNLIYSGVAKTSSVMIALLFSN